MAKCGKCSWCGDWRELMTPSTRCRSCGSAASIRDRIKKVVSEARDCDDEDPSSLESLLDLIVPLFDAAAIEAEADQEREVEKVEEKLGGIEALLDEAEVPATKAGARLGPVERVALVIGWAAPAPGQENEDTRPQPAWLDDDWCSAAAPETGFICTRPKGHPGDHVAHGAGIRSAGRWPQGEAIADAEAALSGVPA